MKRGRSQESERLEGSKQVLVDTITTLQQKVVQLCENPTNISSSTLCEETKLLFLDLFQQNRAFLVNVQEHISSSASKEKMEETSARLQRATEQIFATPEQVLLTRLDLQFRENANLDSVLHDLTSCDTSSNLDYHNVLRSLEEELRLVSKLNEAKERLRAADGINEEHLSLLREFNSKLKGFYEAARYLREELDLNKALQSIRPAENVENLPHPLYKLYYLIFVYIVTYQQREEMQVNILGTLDGQSLPEVGEMTPNEVYNKHPLSVEWVLNFSSTKQIVIVVEYMEYLKIVVATAYRSHFGSRIPYEELLVELFEGDTGEKSPNFANQYILGSKPFTFDYHQASGRPFRWLQVLCGLSFLPDPSTPFQERVRNENPIYTLLKKESDAQNPYREVIRCLADKIDQCAKVW